MLDLLDREMEYLSSINENDPQKKAKIHQFFGEHTEFPTLMDTVETLQCAERVARDYRRSNTSTAAVGFDGIDSNTNNSMHRRLHSTPPSVLSGGDFLSIDDPVEENEAQGWYCGKRSPSPPPLQPLAQSAGDSSPPQSSSHRRNFSTGGIDIMPSLPTFQTGGGPSSPKKHSRSNRYCPSRSNKDSSLFRLIVTLQLCLVRIEEANTVLCNGSACAPARAKGRPRSVSFQSKNSGFVPRSSSNVSSSSYWIKASNSDDSSELSTQSIHHSSSSELGSRERSDWRRSKLLAVVTLSLGGTYYLTTSTKSNETSLHNSKFFAIASKSAAVIYSASYIRKRWRILTMNARIADSSYAIEEWIFSWICLVNTNKETSTDAGYKQLIAPRKSLLWYSNGSIRFQLMKRGMDLLYASIGKAIEITRGGPGQLATESELSLSETKSSSSLWTYVVASLAASYYNVIGPAAKSSQSVATLSSSVIQNAWGMVSLPAIKAVSLEATRILKGAAIADRLEICGVSCFVLSREPCPALASALRRYRRQQHREDVRLTPIIEAKKTMASSHSSSINVKGFNKQNVILHLTGGGFFAHTIAGVSSFLCWYFVHLDIHKLHSLLPLQDLPYLLDWSATSKAVVIIPEYSLFPHKYPDAINEIIQIYSSLRCGQAATLLGFQPDRIIVSGESVGGNLAAALCVSLLTDHVEGECVELTHRRSTDLTLDLEERCESETGDYGSEGSSLNRGLQLPNALMLSCPALNLSLDQTPSRIDGQNDPVLPSALISTIFSSYLGESSVTDPVASPYCASDAVLQCFPPTLIFTSSEDPLLDDSVAFNGRLRSVGVKSRLRAVHDMPHAFWALSTAGIPEARQVQKECQQWLSKMFNQ